MCHSCAKWNVNSWKPISVNALEMIRIAHMGHVNAPMMLGALGVIEMGLIALDIPHGSGGTQKAIEYLGKNVKA